LTAPLALAPMTASLVVSARTSPASVSMGGLASTAPSRLAPMTAQDTATATTGPVHACQISEATIVLSRSAFATAVTTALASTAHAGASLVTAVWTAPSKHALATAVEMVGATTAPACAFLSSVAQIVIFMLRIGTSQSNVHSTACTAVSESAHTFTAPMVLVHLASATWIAQGSVCQRVLAAPQARAISTQ